MNQLENNLRNNKIFYPSGFSQCSKVVRLASSLSTTPWGRKCKYVWDNSSDMFFYLLEEEASFLFVHIIKLRQFICLENFTYK